LAELYYTQIADLFVLVSMQADAKGHTALHYATHGGHIECVNLLLNHKGINPNPSNKAGIKLLDLLIQKGIPKLLSY
jgi:ankyrin repeat protein